jgi:4-carboxymuconolactone decarboxylase
VSSGTPPTASASSLAGRDRLDPPTGALVVLAAAMATGGDHLERACREALRAGVPAGWVDELLLQSVLMVGYPRALSSGAVWRAVSGLPAPATDPVTDEAPAEWRRRGEETCARVYGASYPQVRAAVRALHPALEDGMILEGYGRVLSRPGLDLLRRELCSVAQIATLRTPRQLYSHLRGALHAGASVALVEDALALVTPVLPPRAADLARATWAEVRGGAAPEAP